MKIYKNNEFSESFKKLVRKEISFLKLIRGDCNWEDWEEIVATGMKAKRLNSVHELADIVNEVTAWSAKSKVCDNVFSVTKVKLISGRINIRGNPKDVLNDDANIVGKSVLEIWNNRVTKAKEKFKDIRTIVLLKSKNLNYVSFYEEETSIYNPENYEWRWEKTGVVGYDIINGNKKLMWYPSGTQFILTSYPPKDRIIMPIPTLKKFDEELKDFILKESGFEEKYENISQQCLLWGK